MDMKERLDKLNGLYEKYPELGRAHDMARHILTITDVWSEDQEVIRALRNLEDILENSPQREKIGELKLNTERLNPDVLAGIRASLSPDMDEDDRSLDSKINRMGNREIFERWLEWEGIIGYTDQIKEAVESIFDVDLKG